MKLVWTNLRNELICWNVEAFSLCIFAGFGLQIGNPLLDFEIDFNSRADYIWSHGLISDSTFESFTSVCNNSQIRRQATTGTLTPVCSEVSRQVAREASKFIDPYDVTLDVCVASVYSQSLILSQLVGGAFPFVNWQYCFLLLPWFQLKMQLLYNSTEQRRR